MAVMNRIRPIAGGLRALLARQEMAIAASELLAPARRLSHSTRHRSAQMKIWPGERSSRTSHLASLETERLAAAERQSAVEAGQRRVVAALETERLAAAERQRELENGQRTLLSRLSEIEDSVHHVISTSALKSVESIAAEQRRLGRDMAKIQRDQTAETEALLQLYREFRPRATMPSSGRWAMDPTGLLETLFLIRTKQPKIVLELGAEHHRSGLHTRWRGTADASFPWITRRTLPIAPSHLDLHEISHVAEVRLAELRQLNLNEEEFQWYDLDAFGTFMIDLLLIDGPPGLPETAYPALNVLQSRLAPSAVVILDDADRAGEQTIVQRWITEVTGLRRDREIFNRQAVLTYRRP